MRPSPDFDAVLLAGGRSSRMGRDKALLPHPLDGQPLILRQLELLRSLGPRSLLLSLREGQDYPQVPAEIPRVRDPGTSGPLGALLAALTAATAPRLLVLAVDMPGIGEVFLRRLLVAGADAAGAVPLHADSGIYEPLCAVYPRSGQLQARLEAARSAAAFSLQPLLAEWVRAGCLRAHRVSGPEALKFLTNWNSPGDLPAATRQAGPM